MSALTVRAAFTTECRYETDNCSISPSNGSYYIITSHPSRREEISHISASSWSFNERRLFQVAENRAQTVIAKITVCACECVCVQTQKYGAKAKLASSRAPNHRRISAKVMIFARKEPPSPSRPACRHAPLLRPSLYPLSVSSSTLSRLPTPPIGRELAKVPGSPPTPVLLSPGKFRHSYHGGTATDDTVVVAIACTHLVPIILGNRRGRTFSWPPCDPPGSAGTFPSSFRRIAFDASYIVVNSRDCHTIENDETSARWRLVPRNNSVREYPKLIDVFRRKFSRLTPA